MKTRVQNGKHGLFVVFNTDDNDEVTMSADKFLKEVVRVNRTARKLFRDCTTLTKKQLVCSVFLAHFSFKTDYYGHIHFEHFISKWLPY